MRRLEARHLRVIEDILEMGISRTCSLRIRKELARGKRNCRRRFLRKMKSRMRGARERASGAKKAMVNGTSTGES